VAFVVVIAAIAAMVLSSLQQQTGREHSCIACCRIGQLEIVTVVINGSLATLAAICRGSRSII